MHKCEFPDGMKIMPDGKNELDPCLYETSEISCICIGCLDAYLKQL